MSKNSLSFLSQRMCRSSRAIWTLLACSLTMLSSGCHLLRRATVPIPHLFYAAPSGQADKLIVLLPGIESRAEDFAHHGFPDIIQAADEHADVIAVDAHFTYYWRESLVERLHDDILQPRMEPDKPVWLVGISLGGLGCAVYTKEHPEQISRLLLLAPYMGRPHTYEPIIAAGGLKRWNPPDTTNMNPEQRVYVETWQLHQALCCTPQNAPKVYLGYGTDDRFRLPNGILAAAIPSKRCFVAPGGHDWSSWKPLFRQMLEQALADERESSEHLYGIEQR